MNENINDGGPAFPIPIAGCSDGSVYNTLQQSSGNLGGMTLRDYFAAKAMQLVELEWDTSHDGQLLAIASLCYRIADAMLRVREVQS